MHTIAEIINEMSYLSDKDKREALKLMKIDIIQSNSTTNLKQYRGIGKNIWQKDAQNYINEVRDNDRI